MELTNERNKLSKKLDQLEALEYITMQFVPENKKQIENIRQKLSCLDRKGVKERINIADRNIVFLSNKFGVKSCINKVTDLYKEMKRNAIDKGKTTFLGRWMLKEYFTNVKEIFGSDIWESWPNHVLVGYIPVQTHKQRCEWYLPEAQTYMDMCIYVNRLVSKSQKNSLSGSDLRRTVCDIRGAILQAYIFLEAYLNGIALDYFFENPENIDENKKSLIFEWDFKTNRRKYLQTREKLFKYVKLVNGKPCPISETNCSEMRYIFDELVSFRDSIVHPNLVAFTGSHFDTKKMARHLKISFDIPLNAADSVIILIRKIDKIIGRGKNRLYWLRARDKNGFFPEEVFL